MPTTSPIIHAARPAHLFARELLLRCLRPASDATNEAAIDSLLASPHLDADQLLQLARAQGVLPLVYRALRDRSPGRVPARLLEALRTDAHRIALEIQLHSAMLHRLVKELGDHGVPALVLKGIPLGKLAYGNPAWRKPGDIDLLIQPENYPVVRGILEDLGHRADREGHEAEAELAWKQQMTFRGAPCDVDVHLGLEQASFLRIPYATGFGGDEVWSRRRTVALPGGPVDTLDPEALFAFLAIHGAKHAWSLLFMIVDLAWYAVQEVLDWDRVADLARRLGAERYVSMSLLLAHRLCAVPLPAPWASIAEDRGLGALADRVIGRLFEDRSRTHPLAFHLLQARILPGALDKGRYLFNVCVEHVRRRRRAATVSPQPALP